MYYSDLDKQSEGYEDAHFLFVTCLFIGWIRVANSFLVLLISAIAMVAFLIHCVFYLILICCGSSGASANRVTSIPIIRDFLSSHSRKYDPSKD